MEGCHFQVTLKVNIVSDFNAAGIYWSEAESFSSEINERFLYESPTFVHGSTQTYLQTFLL